MLFLLKVVPALGLLFVIFTTGGAFADVASEKAAEKLVAGAVPFSWDRIFSGKEKVTYLGEVHPSSETRDAIRRSMKELAARGVTHLAFEMLSEDYETAVEKFCKCEGAHEGIRAGFERFGWSPESYMQVAEAAKAEKIEIVALDLTFAIRDKANERMAWLKRFGNGSVYDVESEAGKEYCKLHEDTLKARDEKMAEKIAAIFQRSPDAKVLVLAGGHHVEKSRQPAILKEKHKIASKSFRATSHEMDIIRALRKNGTREKKLFLPTEPGVEFDGYFNLPYEPDPVEVPPAAATAEAH